MIYFCKIFTSPQFQLITMRLNSTNREDFNYQQIDKNIKSSNLIKIFIYKKVKNGKQDKIK